MTHLNERTKHEGGHEKKLIKRGRPLKEGAYFLGLNSKIFYIT
jgi:hypothetical protein